MNKKNSGIYVMTSLVMVLLLALTACSTNDDQRNHSESKTTTTHSHLHSSATVPKGLKVAKDPKYKVGSEVIIHADHMKGMKGATATIVGAYDTTAYAVSYTPTNGGKRVTNHKWVIQEELKNVGDKTLAPGTKVIIEADHMEGMKGAKATIDFSKKTTVYMVDYTPTTGGKMVRNHKWVVESELSPK
ncbi:DUF1541 domain-containing protein [Terrilactibacillus sp. BCM23-1]|uniref:DUF1541 domain-containing protein n=1 Tax=Terrilactibacillus tamarindi TaxID=2599694 RepID=A0A6N8CMR6_9BACI|nr:YdhK family protein [Terrilactibacillus tamarindi]MTT31369.1 DUF1541 domain-containing protein [Terrilactibacillus tamarindi]